MAPGWCRALSLCTPAERALAMLGRSCPRLRLDRWVAVKRVTFVSGTLGSALGVARYSRSTRNFRFRNGNSPPPATTSIDHHRRTGHVQPHTRDECTNIGTFIATESPSVRGHAGTHHALHSQISRGHRSLARERMDDWGLRRCRGARRQGGRQEPKSAGAGSRLEAAEDALHVPTEHIQAMMDRIGIQGRACGWPRARRHADASHAARARSTLEAYGARRGAWPGCYGRPDLAERLAGSPL